MVSQMRLTAYTDYALRALMRMAGEPERWFTAEEMSSTFAISRHHLSKIIARLAAEGFIAPMPRDLITHC
jgi:Rrf2 family nitric oxide-sensitive transcriptional repressor